VKDMHAISLNVNGRDHELVSEAVAARHSRLAKPIHITRFMKDAPQRNEPC